MKGADILKFILSLVVVWIHTGNNTLMGLTGWAVPLFFVLSGFFLWSKIFKENDSDGKCRVVSSWLMKILYMYVIWTMIYLPFSYIGFARDGMPFMKSVAIWLRNCIFVGENYLSWPLWYLLGLLWAGGIIWTGLRIKVPFWFLCVLACILYAVPFICDLEEYHLYTSLFTHTRNGFFIGFPFMMIGGLIRKLCPQIKGWPTESRWHRTSLSFRFWSVHIYFTHMIYAGIMMLLLQPERGFSLWLTTVLIAFIVGWIIWLLPTVQMALFGRVYRKEREK